jgi:aspartate racemase
MKTLGLIGGTSWHSTIVYYQKINELIGSIIGTDNNPPLILHSIPIAVMREQNVDKINTTYLETAQKLEAAGAKAIIICANTPHMAYAYVQPQINIPILHISDAVGIEAKKKDLNTLALLGNRPTMTRGFFQEVLKKNHNLKTLIPDEQYLDTAHHYISKELTQGKFTPAAKDFFLEQIQLLKQKGADGVILGCTELPLLISPKDTDLPTLSTTDLHIQMAVDFILGK